MKKGNTLKYRCCYISYKGLTNKHSSQGIEIIDAIYLGKAGRGKYKDFQNSDYVVQGKHGIVGIGKEQVIFKEKTQYLLNKGGERCLIIKKYKD